MKVLFILDAGIPEYRNFLFEKLSKESDISELLIIHNGRFYNGKGDYKSKKQRSFGNNKFGFYFGLWKYIKEYDVVISAYNLRNISCWIPVFFKKKWIFWGKGLGSKENLLIKGLRRVTAKKSSSILVYNQFKKDEIVNRLSINRNKVIAYNNTIYIGNSENLGGSTKKYFLYFGRIQERKGLIELIQEYSKYNTLSEDKELFKLRFVGNGDYIKVLKNEVSKLSLDDYVEFFPGVYDEECIKNHFKHAKAYVSPFNVGLAIVNSFAYGVPVITCSKPQVGPEFHYLNNENSIIVEDVTDLAEAFENMTSLNSEEKGRLIYDFFNQNLCSNIMYLHFVNTIKSTYYNE